MSDMFSRLRRVTDLFVEGTEVYLGDDDSGKPVVLWVNKLNSFETEEARRDAVSARGLRILELEKDDSPERMTVVRQLKRWDNERLVEQRLNQMGDEFYLTAINEIEMDEEWVEKIDTIRRMPQLLADEGASEDDKRYAQLAELNGDYMEELQRQIGEARKEKAKEFKGLSREQIEEDFLESWARRQSLDEFMAEKRKSEIFASLRDCRAERVGVAPPKFDHSMCDHSKRMLADRKSVTVLPEQVLEKVVDALEGVTVPERTAGNSGAPASSSESSELPSVPEEVSIPSTQGETPPAAPTT